MVTVTFLLKYSKALQEDEHESINSSPHPGKARKINMF